MQLHFHNFVYFSHDDDDDDSEEIDFKCDAGGIDFLGLRLSFQ